MSFENFQFHPKINTGIAACGYTVPTPIQKGAIPSILAGRDIIGLAQTGTGKTAAFVLPILQRLIEGPRKRVRALIVAPTRELAEQIHDNIGRMAQKTGLRSVVIYGGVGKQPQIKKIRAGVEIVVACPGRLLDLLDQKAVNLGAVEVLVLDEADHMFDKGFLPDIREIIRQLPRERQSLIFSATMPKPISHLAEKILRNPARIQINHTLPLPTISHVLFQVAKERKTSLLKSIIQEREMNSTLVFTRTKHKAKSLALHLSKAGYSATSLQGNLSQQKRQRALDGFRDGTFKILVATDIAARGLDVLGISHVINYDVPDTAEAYTHRTGRTGRATRTGQALSFVSREDSKIISLIEHKLGKKMLREVPPAFVCEAGGGVREQKRRNISRQMPRRKKAVTAGRGKSRRNRASSFDFGISKTAHR
ncbi:MAG: DEAD/DEAH box helicase [Desulfatiglans sp.]|jgi:superfamily II DNA/RNA helicase|nr:DEAD/DEAH box helicase [Thermodesulfobacteriota bacterium]MEE4354223.1 DEAD/DEAH box helicase [Desulfatiglans sp.]